ncbi:ABC transporter permease subunit [Agrobacterium vitis]|uniref:ABC transporter permease subunit n=1 Tax=Agrobacterium vitis TaxID=373 RepID=A0A368NL72_AGRVI|nr:ABC transporter permease [Agrobacterium vitis]KAA3506298.1 ABC transporter permease subunit [Agrobacterium vitis]KAA3520714.1 ABC transporter permease subunit [Agrobacterium vitis]MCF1480267.1 ABC transporter permease [Agrobacterium vitis]MUZ99614.1 ABC transporter permease subunit [Agrobacterium vitis]MVA32386.1 ABC transporter permease subunit [Agrobacterium vitis]
MPTTSLFSRIMTGFVFFFLLAPLVIIFGASLTNGSFLAFPPQDLSFRWFSFVLENQSFMDSFKTSFVIATIGTGFAMLVGIPVAYALARYRSAIPGWFGSIFFLPILVPEIVFGFSLLKSVIVTLELSVMTALMIGHTIIAIPYAVRVVGASLAGFDFSVEEAAISLGCSPLKTFFVVVLPNIRSGIVAAFILAFISSMNDVSVSLFLTGPGVSTLPINLFTYVEQHFDPSVAAVSVLLMLLTAIVIILVERTLGLSKVMR